MAELLFQNTLQISLILAEVTLVLLIFRPLIQKHFSAASEYTLLFLVMLRGLIPFHKPVTLPSIPAAVSKIPKTVQAEQTPFPVVLPAPLEAVTPEISGAESVAASCLELLPWIWLWGIAAVLAITLILHQTTAHHYRSNTKPVCDKKITAVFLSAKSELGITKSIALKTGDCIQTPMLSGLFHPTLYIPQQEMSAEQLLGIFRHELIHYKRGDLLKKLIFLFGKAVHWFNPFVWILGNLADCAMELSNDDEVLKDANSDFRKKYGYAILSMAVAEQKRDILSTKFYGGKKQMQNRLQNLSKKRSPASGKLLVSLGLILIIGIGSFTGCKREAPNPESGSVPPETGFTSPESSAVPEESSAPETLSPNIPLTNLSNLGHSSVCGIITELTGDSITIEEEKGGILVTYQLDENTVINVPAPDGLKEGDSVFIISTDGSLAQIISIADIVGVGGGYGTTIVSPPTNIKDITANYDPEQKHDGVDLVSSDGDYGRIFASVNGKVIKAEYAPNYGNYIIIQSNEIEGLTFLYAHCSELFVKEGDSVIRSQPIGKIGNSGMSTGNHLHFEVRKNDEPTDPTAFLGTANFSFQRNEE